MKPVDFEYERPNTVDETLGLLRFRVAETKILAGGQSLIPLLVTRALRPVLVVDIGRVHELRYIREDAGGIRIGATMRQAACADSELVRSACPLLADAIAWVATPQVRNLGTLVGSMAQRNAISEIPTVAAALGAVVTVIDDAGHRREVAAADFLDPLSPLTLRPNELAIEARFPRQPRDMAWAFLETQRRHAHYALVGVAVAFRLDEAGRITGARVAAGGVARCTVRLNTVEAALEGRVPSPEVFLQASGLASGDPRMDPPDDLDATADYRRRVSPVVIRRALDQAHARRVGAGR
jgi:carbon-monoxide dehydrogenase medium subunit